MLGFLKRKPSMGPREDLPDEVKRVVGMLKDVKDPETDLNIVEEGLLYGLTVEEGKVDVFLLLARSTPECHFCQTIAMNVQRRILGNIIEALRDDFWEIRIYNELGLLLEAYQG